MTSASTGVIDDFLEAVLARDFERIESLADEGIDFRAMTPTRIWEGAVPSEVGEVVRAWFEHPEREVERVEPVEASSVADTARVGWRVYGQGADGPFVYEQQAFVRERDGQIVWLRIMCSGPRPAGSIPTEPVAARL